MKGLPNLGATCWLNALVQCMRASREWDEECSETDQFTCEFLKLMNEDHDNTTDFLKHLPTDPFSDGPNDSQEALMYILDKLEKTIELKDFTGEVTQTVVFPGGKSVTKNECTVWFHTEKDDVVENYTDSSGHTHNVSVVQRRLTKVPKILLSDHICEKMFDKKLFGIIHWGWGHYVAFVREGDEWYCANDSSITKATPVMRGYVGFYR